MNTYDMIYDAVRRIPRGKVATYGQIACAVGNPRLARIVGFALHMNPDPDTIPCHRVVNREGKVAEIFAFGGDEIQRKLLEAEGITFKANGCVDLEKYQM